MIDVVINETGGITVAHDQKSLDICDTLHVDTGSGAARLTAADGTAHPIGTLKAAMLDMVYEGMPGRSVRTSGWSIARHGELAVHVSAGA